MADVKKTDAEKKPKESSKDKSNKSKKTTLAKVQKIFWIAICILIFLLLISLVILSSRMYEYIKIADDDRTIKITADEVEKFDIFSAEYSSSSGTIFIQSNNGDKVVAPGAATEYTIRIKNEDKVALDYNFNPIVKEVGPRIPIQVRLVTPDQEYLVGGPKSWGTFEDLLGIDYTATIAKNEVHEYELEWKWPFEGDDAYDTQLGNAATGSVSIEVGMELHAESNLSGEANGTWLDYGIEGILIAIIFFILLLIAIILLILSLMRRKVAEPEPQVVFVPAPEPPAPEPVVAPAPITNKKKDKGFVGKMEFVNIDTLVDSFNNGDTISLKILKEKGLVDPKANQVKILARGDGKLEKVFHIETQGISAQARKKVIEAGGTVKIIDG